MTEDSYAICILIAFGLLFLLMILSYELELKALRKENKMLRRVLEDYFRLEDKRQKAQQSILWEMGHGHSQIFNSLPGGKH